MVSWTLMKPCWTRSPSSTRVTPIGIFIRAETSATDRLSQTPRIRCDSGLEAVRSTTWGMRTRVASKGRSTTASVRPPVRVYGRTNRGAGSLRSVMASHHPGLRLHDSSDAVHQEGHLVADLADVRLVLGEDGEVGAVTDGHQHEVAVLHLDDGLEDLTALEEAGGADGEAGEARGHGRHLL